MRGALLVSAAAAGALLSGCLVGPDYVRPKTASPQSFSAQSRDGGATLDAAADPAQTLAEWWKGFGDPELDRLIAAALKDNFDIRIASARIVQARAQLDAASAGLFPSFSGTASAKRYRVPDSVRNLPQQAASAIDPAAGGAVGATGFKLPGYISLYQANFDVSWELDLWGGTRRSIESTAASADAAFWSRRGAVVSTLAELGNDYAALRATQKRIVLAGHTLDDEQQLLALTDNRRQHGFASELDVAQARAQLETTRATLPPLQSQALQRIHAIAILLGVLPESLEDELSINISAAPTLPTPPSIPVGLPSAVLLNRPDVQAADRQFAAANAQIGTALAQRLPNVSLTGATGLTSTAIENLLKSAAWSWNAGASLSAPIFDFGRLQANQRASEAAAEQQFLQYKKTVLQAFQDVEDSLDGYAAATRQREALNAAVDAAALSLLRATDQYRAGLASYLNVLDADRTLSNSQDQLVQSDQMRLQSLVSLYKALGGGWQSPEAQWQPQLRIDTRWGAR